MWHIKKESESYTWSLTAHLMNDFLKDWTTYKDIYLVNFYYLVWTEKLTSELLVEFFLFDYPKGNISELGT